MQSFFNIKLVYKSVHSVSQVRSPDFRGKSIFQCIYGQLSGYHEFDVMLFKRSDGNVRRS
jgi:hypothetical protein